MSANTLTGLIPTIYEALDVVSRELVGFIPAVGRDANATRAAVGQTLRSPVVPTLASANITPSNTSPNAAGVTVGSVDISISKAKAVEFNFTGPETLGTSSAVGTPVYGTAKRDMVAQAIRTLVNEIEADLYASIRANVSRAYGTAGTAPFASSGDLTDLAQVLKILQDNGCPISGPQDVRMVLNTTASASLRAKQGSLWKVNEYGSDEVLRMGRLGNLFGFGIGESGAITAPVTKGAGTGALVNAGGGLAIGTTTIPFDTMTVNTTGVVAGDVITFAADTANKYVVVTGSTSTSGNIVIAGPGLRVAIPDNNAITIGNSFTPSLAFHRSAFQLLQRLPELPEGGDSADDRTVVVDPVSGLAFEFSVYRQYRQVRYEVAAAWGVGAIKPAHGAMLLG